MSFQWMQLRISEESDRRKREAVVKENLPRALAETHEAVVMCVESYREAFGDESADVQLLPNKIRVTVRAERDGKWQQIGRVELVVTSSIPGFQIDKGTGGEPLIIEVGMLPGDKIFYCDRAMDQYVTLEEFTRRALDRALFPDLNE
jgi:hypothetical protein